MEKKPTRPATAFQLTFGVTPRGLHIATIKRNGSTEWEFRDRNKAEVVRRAQAKMERLRRSIRPDAPTQGTSLQEPGGNLG